MDKWLKKIPAKKLKMIIIMEAKANNKKMAELTFLLNKSSLSAILQGNNSDDLIRSHKNSAKKIWNYQY